MRQYFQADFKEFLSEHAKDYDYIIFDPPWKFNNKVPNLFNQQLTYNLWNNNIEDLRWIFENTNGPKYMFIWTCNSIINEVFEAAKDTGWIYKTMVTWVKQTNKGNLFYGLGNTFRNATEQIMVFQRPKTKALNLSLRNVFMAPAGVRTIKPKEFEGGLIKALNSKGMNGVYIFCGDSFGCLDIDGVDILPSEAIM